MTDKTRNILTIIKTSLIGTISILYGISIVMGIIYKSTFPMETVWGRMSFGDVLISAGITLFLIVAIFTLDYLTNGRKNIFIVLFYFLWGIELSAFGILSLIQGGGWWYWFMIALGFVSALLDLRIIILWIKIMWIFMKGKKKRLEDEKKLKQLGGY